MVSGLLAVVGPAPALAQPRGPVTEATKDMARNHYRAGETKFKEGNYQLALQYYTAAENILPVPTTKYKIAVCNDKLGNTAEAVRWYQTFLDSNPPDKMAESIADARARIAALRVRAQSSIQLVIMPANAPGLSVSIDGGPPQNVASVLTTPPGRHRVIVRGPGFNPAVVDLDVAPGEAKQISINLNNVGGGGPGPGPTPGPTTQRSNIPAFVLIGVGGASIIVGAAFGGLALQSRSAFNSHPRGDTTDADNEQLRARVSDGTLFGGIGLAAVGVVLLLTNPPRPAQQGSIRPLITPYAGPGGAGLVGRLTF